MMLKLETLFDHKGHIISGEVLCNLLLNKILTFWIVKCLPSHVRPLTVCVTIRETFLLIIF